MKLRTVFIVGAGLTLLSPAMSFAQSKPETHNKLTIDDAAKLLIQQSDMAYSKLKTYSVDTLIRMTHQPDQSTHIDYCAPNLYHYSSVVDKVKINTYSNGKTVYLLSSDHPKRYLCRKLSATDEMISPNIFVGLSVPQNYFKQMTANFDKYPSNTSALVTAGNPITYKGEPVDVVNVDASIQQSNKLHTEVYIGKIDHLIRGIDQTFNPGNSHFSFEYTNLHVNNEMPASVISFTPSKGWKLVGNTSPLPSERDQKIINQNRISGDFTLIYRRVAQDLRTKEMIAEEHTSSIQFYKDMVKDGNMKQADADTSIASVKKLPLTPVFSLRIMEICSTLLKKMGQEESADITRMANFGILLDNLIWFFLKRQSVTVEKEMVVC